MKGQLQNEQYDVSVHISEIRNGSSICTYLGYLFGWGTGIIILLQ
jgi:hypothetical protein